MIALRLLTTGRQSAKLPVCRSWIYFTALKSSIPFEAGQAIFSEGEPGDLMYVVLEGEAEIRVHDKLVGTAGPGEIFGEMALVDAEPRSATVIAKTACRVVPIGETQFHFMIRETPHFATAVMRVMCQRLRQRAT